MRRRERGVRGTGWYVLSLGLGSVWGAGGRGTRMGIARRSDVRATGARLEVSWMRRRGLSWRRRNHVGVAIVATRR